jgi:hypothetical protein
MLPNTPNVDDLVLDFKDEKQQKTKTFRLDMTSNTVGGKVDGLTALKQHIYLTLSIEADQYIIYPYTLGIKTLDLIGKPSYYVMAVLPNRIKNALLSDSRITDVSNFEFEVTANRVNVKFIVYSIYGEIEEETAVIY